MKDLLRKIPSIHEIQQDAVFKGMIRESNISSEQGTELIKEEVARIRGNILDGSWDGPMPGSTELNAYIIKQAGKAASQKFTYTLTKVINASGTILHTNLGRARLSETAVHHVMEIARNYSNLEYDIEKGSRGSRHKHAEILIKEATGAEAAMVVNNNAAAVFLILSALAKNKEVIVSRGELVEIGGSFRVSSIMEESGAALVEVGTTNKTRKKDYEEKINENTSMVMKVHRSNFVIKGFTEEAVTEDLVQLASSHEQVIFYEDLGSGMLYDLKKHNIGSEPLVKDVISKGADLVSFSGDKLLGGPQAGIIAGKKEIIDILKKHQLARVLRVDKMTLAALEGTLIDYLKGKESNIPAYRSLLLHAEEVKKTAETVISYLKDRSDHFSAEVKPAKSQVGGGTMPDVELDTYVLSLKHTSLDASQLEKALRKAATPIIGRIQRDEFLLDFRTADQTEIPVICQSLLELDRQLENSLNI
ncbi:L-seryl-tRNA(Sec) selenium transferase [Rossellomorea vietnamensis]|uniref:L-seryl-tRNA(Sec) selenium transferase n=1 Tax=Rossellomorea vietnamensis TaxID=218284 RepID=A0A5D4K645_9BACI|nr:L-seryl-tRNA(Sec) selenium transferase [Rossellomorea vietnamensis]TYR72748.1 L-seryl-tRNA(Sec) selenium transferase [Rossellomorea vietnamensis]